MNGRLASHPRNLNTDVLPAVHGRSVTRGLDAENLDALAARAAEGDDAAFDALVREVFESIRRWALVRLGDEDDADDVTQRVLVRLHTRLADWEGRARFTTWLYRITANEAVSWQRRMTRRLRRRATLEVDDPKGPEDLDRKRLAERLRVEFRGLPRRQREIMDLIDFQGFSPAETAEMLEMNPSTVRANLFKARRALRSRILESDPNVEELLP